MNAQGRDVAPIVLPVGHYQGPFHPGGGLPPSHHLVRLGWEPVQLTEEIEVDVWGLAHGLPAEQAGAGAWTRSAVLDAALDAGHSDAGPVLDRLLDRGLVVEVTPGTGEAREFARRHRLQPLLIGLGQTPAEPLDAIGVPGLVVALRATPRVFEVWEWTHLWPDLWAACEGLAEAGRDTGRKDPTETDPDQVLTFVLGAVQTLIAHGAAYLDHRPRPAPRL
jgi:hypothetical protein